MDDIADRCERHPGPTLVLGGTGHFGRRIVQALADRGEPVRVLSRDEARARALLGDGLEIVQGDITARVSLRQALSGARGVVIAVSAFSPALIRLQKPIERDAVLMALEEAAAAGISRIVYISVYDLRESLLDDLGVDFVAGRIKLEIEKTLAGSAFDWTVLGACPSMQLFFSLIRGHTMAVPGGGPPALPTISARDVGAIGAEAATRSDLGRRRIRMTGPEALSFAEAAARISAATGLKIGYRKVPTAPLEVASLLAMPFTPYLRQVVASVRLMNRFPQDLAASVPEEHRRLLETFTYSPSTLEDEAREWARGRA